MTDIQQRRPTMAEHQAVTAFKDAVRRMRLRGLGVVTTRGGDVMTIRLGQPPLGVDDETVQTASFPGIEGRDGPILACFDGAARWLEERETELVGIPTRENPIQVGDDKEDMLALQRCAMRFHDGVWISLDQAYLHRIFMWPPVASQEPNRAARRKWEATHR